MASELETTLNRLAEKSRYLTRRFEVVTAQRDEALERVAQLEKELLQHTRRLQRLQAEVDYLKTSSVLAPTAESVTATRAMIRELIRQIDTCIAEIKD